MARRKPTAGAHPLLLELERWSGLRLETGREHRGIIRAQLDGEPLEIEISIRVRRHAGADEVRERRAEVLAFLRRRPELASHCGVNIEKRSTLGGRGYADSCKGQIVAAVVHALGSGPRLDSGGGSLGCLFVCTRHREKHGIHGTAVLATIELTPSDLREPRAMEEERRFAWERKTRIEEHDRGEHRDIKYLQGFKPGVSETEIRRYWDGGRRIAPCARCLEELASASASAGGP